MTAALTAQRLRPRRFAPVEVGQCGLLGLAALTLGAVVSLQPVAALLATAGLVGVVVVAVRPVVGVYALIVVTPLTAGIERAR